MVLAERMGALVVSARRRPHARRSASATTVRWSAPTCRPAGQLGGRRRAAADAVVDRDRRQRARGGRRTRHRDRRVEAARARATSPISCRSSCRPAKASAGLKARSSSRAARACRCSKASTSRRRSRASLLVLQNNDQPGVIGGVGTSSASHGINIASFALGRDASGAVGVVALDSARRRAAAAGRGPGDSRPAGGPQRPSRHDHAAHLTTFRQTAAGPPLWYHAAVIP